MKKDIFVVGHRNPDTDSICSAISYAYLKNAVEGDRYLAVRAGEINPETSFVLDYFNVNIPDYIEDVRAQVKDENYEDGVSISGETSIVEAWELLHKQGVSTLNIVDKENKVLGIVSVGDIAKFFMEAHTNSVLAEAKTSYTNIRETLNGKVILGNIENKVVEGKILVAAGKGDFAQGSIEKNDIVVLVDDISVQKTAIENGAACLIVCLDASIDDEVIEMAKSSGSIVINSSEDILITSRLLNQSIPVKHFMKSEKLISFSEDDFIDDVKNIVADTRHREFPIIDKEGKFKGVIKRANLIDTNRKKIIMVDHNETNQGVKGILDSEIVEIVDHHKVGHIRTSEPIFYRNMPVGCTSTIVYTRYMEEQIEIPREMAGLMCSAILSDTLLFKSPTCTPLDKAAAMELSLIAGIEIEEYALKMFGAGSDFGSRTIEEIFNSDYKKFNVGELVYGIGQISSVSKKELDGLKDRILAYMNEIIDDGSVNMVYLMLTDIMTDSSELLCAGEKAVETAVKAFGVEGRGQSVFLEGRVSRKKQIVPQLAAVLQ